MMVWTYETRPADPSDRTPGRPDATEIIALYDGVMIRSMGVWEMPHQAKDVASKLNQWGGRQVR